MRPCAHYVRMSDHHSLEIWQMAHALVKDIHRVRRALPREERWVTGDQLWRAAVSVPCNIVEGYARSTELQLQYHLGVAMGSNAEADYLVELVAELGLVPTDMTDPLRAGSALLQRKLRAFQRSIREGRSRHARFR